MRGTTIRTIILAWTLVTFLVDLYAAINSGNVGIGLILVLMSIELLTCWIAYQMLMGKKWALVTLTIYYGLRAINVYTDAFTFYSKSGLNLEISIGKTIGLNLLTIIVFIVLIRELAKAESMPAANKVHMP
jgi:hypothetical protein